MDLRSYIGRRFLLLIPTVLGAILLLFFFLTFLDPYQRAQLFATSPQQMQHLPQIIDKYSLDAPFYVQLYNWLGGLLHGNLGFSQVANKPVLDAFFQHVPATLELFMFGAPITIWASIKMGVASATHHNEATDHATRVGSIIGYAMPNFWLGLLLLWLGFGVLSGFLPPGRLSDPVENIVFSPGFTQYTRIHTIDAILNLDPRILIDTLRHLILPVTTLVVSSWALTTRITRSSMLNVLRRGYITTARAKGLPEEVVINKHARRNALIPVVTVAGYLVISFLLGSFIVETIFNFHGIGQFFVTAATSLDYGAIIGFTLIFTIIILIVNLIIDILYAKIDPRVRLG